MTPTAVYRDAIRRLARTERSDEELLDRFRLGRDESAFEELLRRHGPMVRAVCRRTLGDRDADDAFQATFLVMVRKVGSIERGRPLANWLCGVAYKTARQALRYRLKQHQRERQVAVLPEPPTSDKPSARDWLPLLDAAIQALPEGFRIPLILCDLQGLSRTDAAQRLGLREGTLSSRLARARHMLRRRLGCKMSSLALVAVFAPVLVPAALVRAMSQSATAFLPGRPLPVGTVPTRILDLVKGVLSAMHFSSWKVGASFVILVALVGVAVFGSVHQGLLMPAAQAADTPHDLPLPRPVSDKPLDPLASEQEQLQGAWRMVRHERDGEVIDQQEDVVFVFAGQRFLQAGRNGLAEGKYQVEPDRNPKRIDIVNVKITEGQDKDKTPAMSLYGIYKLEDDRLTICFGPQDKRSKRPAEFVGEKDADAVLIVLERVGGSLRSSAPSPRKGKEENLDQADLVMTTDSFHLPLSFDVNRIKDLRDVTLYSSDDKGQTWQKREVVSPDKKGFEVKLPKPGLYWFTIVLTTKDGRREPTDPNAIPPMMRVRVQEPESAPQNEKPKATPPSDGKQALSEAYRDQARTRFSLAEKRKEEGKLRSAAEQYEMTLEQLRFWASADNTFSLERESLFWNATSAAAECWDSVGEPRLSERCRLMLEVRLPGYMATIRGQYELIRGSRLAGERDQCRDALQQLTAMVDLLDEKLFPENKMLQEFKVRWEKIIAAEREELKKP